MKSAPEVPRIVVDQPDDLETELEQGPRAPEPVLGEVARAHPEDARQALELLGRGGRSGAGAELVQPGPADGDALRAQQASQLRDADPSAVESRRERYGEGVFARLGERPPLRHRSEWHRQGDTTEAAGGLKGVVARFPPALG